MPLYEYRCDKCSLAFEELVSSASASVDCPRCHAQEVTRQLSVFSARGSADASPAGCGDGSCEFRAPPSASGGGCCGGGGCCH